MVLSNKNIKIIKNYFKALPVKRVFIFGSYARGDADFKSDIDLYVEIDYNKTFNLDIKKCQLELQKKTGKFVDIYAQKKILKYSNINYEKKLIFKNT
ncbi:MAG: nucleotidyltransferase domain-containing protein [Bacteroidetes bacterium]|nr:nucleotidyltransferase domain-containing protein [Bacteroidota bacterium]